MMTDPLRLLCVFAHPDDESLGTGGTLAKYAAEGVETFLICATRGQRGWMGAQEEYPGPEALGRTRDAELREAARVLGVHGVEILDFGDGDLDEADPANTVALLVEHLRRIRPHVVVTFAPDGGYGHPDHIAISQFTTTAVVCAADESYHSGQGLDAHRVAKLYYRVWTSDELAGYTAAFGEIAMEIDGVRREAVGWPDWSVTTRLDTLSHWRTAWEAVACHRTQLPAYHVLEALPAAAHERLWGVQNYYRVLSTVNGGRAVETDLFAGLR